MKNKDFNLLVASIKEAGQIKTGVKNWIDVEFKDIKPGDKIKVTEHWADLKGGIYTEVFIVKEIIDDYLVAATASGPWVNVNHCTYEREE